MAQAVQIRKQTPEGSRRGLLDSPEHTEFSQPASWVPLWPLTGPGDVALLPRVLWLRLFRSRSRQLKAPAGACWIHQSTLSPLSRPPGCPSFLLQDLAL